MKHKTWKRRLAAGILAAVMLNTMAGSGINPAGAVSAAEADAQDVQTETGETGIQEENQPEGAENTAGPAQTGQPENAEDGQNPEKEEDPAGTEGAVPAEPAEPAEAGETAAQTEEPGVSGEGGDEPAGSPAEEVQPHAYDLRILLPETQQNLVTGKDGESIRYYNAAQVIAVHLTDSDLDPAASYVTWLEAENGIEKENRTLLQEFRAETQEAEAARYDILINLRPGRQIRQIALSAADKEGRPLGFEEDETALAELARTAFIADTEAPVFSLTVSGSGIRRFYTAADEDGEAGAQRQIYVEFEKPASGESGHAAAGPDEEICLTAAVTDRNLASDAQRVSTPFCVTGSSLNRDEQGNPARWKGSVRRNADATLTYTCRIRVPADETKSIRLSFGI